MRELLEVNTKRLCTQYVPTIELLRNRVELRICECFQNIRHRHVYAFTHEFSLYQFACLRQLSFKKYRNQPF